MLFMASTLPSSAAMPVLAEGLRVVLRHALAALVDVAERVDGAGPAHARGELGPVDALPLVLLHAPAEQVEAPDPDPAERVAREGRPPVEARRSAWSTGTPRPLSYRKARLTMAVV
jgi:hypothetical protein